MKRNLIETIMGAVVICVAVFFVVTAYRNSGIQKEDGYQITAAFDRIDGISRGTDVKIGGIKVGSVEDMRLDPATYRAEVTMGINNNIKLPADSTAEVSSDGLLGGKFVNIVPGADEEMLKANGRIEYTQSSINLEQLLGKFAFGSADKQDEPEQPVAAPEGTDEAEPDPAAPLPATTPAPKAELKPEAKKEPAPKPAEQKAPKAEAKIAEPKIEPKVSVEPAAAEPASGAATTPAASAAEAKPAEPTAPAPALLPEPKAAEPAATAN